MHEFRQRLTRYRSTLTAEINSTQQSLQRHAARNQAVVAEAETQEQQLTCWGLQSLIPEFWRLAHLRSSRIKLEQDMDDHTIRILELRAEEAKFLLDTAKDSDANVESEWLDEAFFLPPKELREQD